MAARRVLLIEDNAGAREGLRRLLVDDGYVVRTAPTGERGLACAGAFAPDIVVCDLALPGINGLDVLRGLRRAGSRVFFVMLTSGSRDLEVERTLRSEADAFLSKPVDLPRFRALLAAGSDGAMPRPLGATH